MANTSATGGYLSPVNPAQADDLALDQLIQPIIVGITGLPDASVIIKGQAVPPTQASRPTTWCAFAVTSTAADLNPSIVHDGRADCGNGQTTEVRNEFLEVTASFYGPASRGTATLLRDGLGISQNREAMRTAGLAYVSLERITFVPDFENTQYIRRADLVFKIRRVAVKTYAIQNILSAEGQTIADSGSTSGQRNVITPIQAGP